MLYQKVCAEKKRLDKKIRNIETRLKGFPPGKMYITHNGKYFKWYYKRENDSTPVYIPKSQRSLAEQYAQKKYLMQLKSDLLQERNALDYYIRHHKVRPWKSDDFLNGKPEYHELLSPYFQPRSKELRDWANASYPQNPYYKEKLLHHLDNGKSVRSKSEYMISSILDKYQIPYRVEEELVIGSNYYYPDFTIRHPQTGEFYYYEHFGLIEKYNYLERMAEKLYDYISIGIIPSKNLIMTFETNDYPLTIERIEALIKEYFL